MQAVENLHSALHEEVDDVDDTKGWKPGRGGESGGINAESVPHDKPQAN